MISEKMLLQKKAMRRQLAGRSFDEKLAILIRLQRMACEMAKASNREFKGVVWGGSQATTP